MDREEFGWLVARLEAEAANRPAAFRGKVILISCAAYIALFFALALYVVLVVAGWRYVSGKGLYPQVMVGFFTLAALPVFYGVLRTVLSRRRPPQGREIARADAPVLFDLLDKMRRKLNGPPIHHVLVDTDYNAAIAQLPRWGLVGPHRNYLVLGLPFLLGCQTSEMMAVVAHEYGHVCGAHGKVGVWVYRQRRTLYEVYENVRLLKDDSFWHGAMFKVLERFMPYHDAYTFVMARQDEYDADRIASSLAGLDASANGLIRSTLQGRWFAEEFWPALYRQAETRERPAFMPYQAMRTAFRIGHSEWATETRLKAAWREQSNVEDSHPCLRERIEALGLVARLPQPVTASAADTLLGASAKVLVDEFDRDWWTGESKAWSARHRHAARSRVRLEELASRPLHQLELHALQEFALLKEEFDSPLSAKPVLEHLMRRSGGPFPKAEYTYGRILLGEGNRNGLGYLSAAARNDRRLADDALKAGYIFLCEKSGEEQAQAWVDQVWEKA